MSKRAELLGRLGKLGSEALISAANLKREVEAQGMDRLERVAKKLKLVRREEFESVQAMIKQARSAQEQILDRLARIESKLGVAPVRKSAPSRKSAVKKKN